MTRLREAAGRGEIDLDELEHRIDAAYAARTGAELAPVTADLPVRSAHKPATPQWSRRRPLVFEDDEFRGHFTVYCLVIGMLIGIWLLSGGGHFWPFYPAAGWGVGLGGHYQRAISHQRKRAAKAHALGISLAELDGREDQEAGAEREQRRGRRRTGSGQSALPAPSRQRTSDDTPSRRFVVAMFVDVVGSTGLNEVLGDEGWIRVRDRLRTTLGECFAREGGWEVNTAGDGVLARFDDPNGAVCAAVEIHRRLSRERDETGFAPSVRIGIHSGDVVDDGDDLIGRVVNLASRVTSAAEPGQVIVTEHVVDHLDSSFDTEDRGIHSLKGVARPRHLLAVRWR